MVTVFIGAGMCGYQVATFRRRAASDILCCWAIALVVHHGVIGDGETFGALSREMR